MAKPGRSSHNGSNKTGSRHNSPVTKAKAKKILRDGSVRGKALTKKQKGFFGARAGGTPVKRMAR
jgi:hypothetical protein